MSGLFERWTGTILLEPAWLGLAVLVLAALWWRHRRGAHALLFAPAFLLPSRGEAALPRSWRVRLRALPRILTAAGLLALLVALARPVERVALPRRTLGLDILLALDTSSSMTATDLDPERTRLHLAREAAAAFVAARPQDRIGLVEFARYPDLRCPLTRDHDALTRILASIDTVEGDGPEDATGLGTALARAAEVLRGARTRAGVIVLLTDGEENVALAGQTNEIAPVHAAQLCEQLGYRVYTIVVGLGHRTPAGDWVALDTRAVEQVADRTGGTFHSARDAGAIADVYERIAALEMAPFEEPRFGVEERHLVFLALGLLLLLLARALAVRVWDAQP